MLIRAKKNRAFHIQKSKTKKRERKVEKQLLKDSKRGGIIDKRKSDRTVRNDDEADILRRNILEKLKTLNELKTFDPDSSENIVKASESTNKYDIGSFANDLDDENIDSDVVNALFDEKQKEGEDFKDFLARKIEETRVARQMKVESNELNRETMEQLNEEWSQNIRFILDKVKFSTKKALPGSEDKRKLVNSLLESLKTSNTVVPASKAAPKTEEKKQDMLVKIFKKPVDPDLDVKSLSPLALLRIISVTLDNEEFRNQTVLFVSSLISKYPNIKVCNFENIQKDSISDIIRVNLFLLYLTEKILQVSRISKVFYNELVINSFRNFQTFLSAVKEDPVLTNIDENIPIKNVFSSSDFSQPKVIGQIINKYLELFNDNFSHSESIHESLITFQIFSPLCEIFDNHLARIPAKSLPLLKSLREQILALAKKPLPPTIVRRNVISSLIKNEEGFRKKDVIQLGIVPQLEPVFEEVQYVKGAKRPATTDVNELNRRLKKEKRAAMRDLRKDAQTIASVQLKKIRENDAERKRLTQGIISSMRSVEDMKK